MNALKGFIGAAPEGGREQTIWTPEFILDAVDLVFPDGWGDPFPSEGSPATRRAKLGARPDRNGMEITSWYSRNFANPPYAELKDALQPPAVAWWKYEVQSVLLIPVRTRREWWCGYVRGAAVAYLKPIAFLDARTGKPYPGTFAENLAAVYFGDRKATFTTAFAPLAHHVQESF